MLKNKKPLTGAILGLSVLSVMISGCNSKNTQSPDVKAQNTPAQNNQSQFAPTQDTKARNTNTQQTPPNTDMQQGYQRLADVEQIKQLKARYFRFIDEKKWTDFGNIFTSDAKLVSDGVDYSKGGGQGYGKMIGDLVGKAPTVHHGFMPEIQIIDNDHAKGVWAMEDMLTFPAAKNAYPGHHGYGQYHETYRKENGVWKISSTVLTRFRVDPLKNWDPNTDPVTGQPVKASTSTGK